MKDADLAEPIRCILSDVDGVMTDGRIIYDSSGVETKQFNVRDGLGIKLWMKSGFRFGILTARNSPVVQRRGEELGIDSIQQGFEQKLPAAMETWQSWGIAPAEVCYIGDDLPDLPVMRQVGLAVAPVDASLDVRNQAQWVLRSKGGEGAVRELVDRLLRAKNRWEEHVRVS
ncbi:3-deoxy-D-manno-octulosonate 8-phosphate phosphatase KdsC [Rubripirellula amarantea]|uniref:3-deoxy-D-manno-octulosonate 8-phosphate phosphatase KdsC n=1 Tax=Rubripirellula amarantea TaxID=2527999 RepID=A0A5C5WCB4_9BACT|nr:HAD hydrolase family protein [Rubripirellula amarantea]TWT48177.1 3-deoxy-D-manno-octulosonate 8-phosphate phosphatase KdsC [Rubripirellula amarantea]